MFLSEGRRIFTGEFFEGFVEVRNIFKAAFITSFRYRFILHQYFFGLIDAEMIEKISKGIMG